MAGLSRLLRGGVAALAMMTATGPAAAAVTYTFEASSAFGTPFGKFVYEAPTFITAETFVPAASLTSCTVTSPASGFTCGTQRFIPGDPANGIYDFIGFATQNTTTAYYFAPGALGAFGIYETQLFGTDQAARLIVSRSGGPGPVPEPATWAMMIAGFGIMGGAMRYRRRQVRVTFA